MKKNSRIRLQFGLVILLFLFLSCSGLFMEPDPDSDPVSVFNTLWQDFDRLYCFFDYKNIDWNAVYSEFRPQVEKDTPETILFRICSEMLMRLHDGHVNIRSPFGYSGYSRPAPPSFDKNNIILNYLSNSNYYTANIFIFYGNLEQNIGYVHISSFREENNISDFDKVLESFKNDQAIILDVRNNDGGISSKAEYVASRFLDKERIYGYKQYKNGPEHDNFSEPQKTEISPSDKWRFLNPVLVLSNRKTGSTGEVIVLMMKVIPHVTVVGDTTAGLGSTPILRELQNDWNYSLSTTISLTADKKKYEGVGVAPDIYVSMNEQDIQNGIDPILEKALEIINSK